MSVPTNKTEMAAYVELEANFWTVDRNGYPDFICVRGSDLILVEVKRSGEKPRQEQTNVMEMFEQKGIPCFVWTPRDGFVRVGNPCGTTVPCNPPASPIQLVA